MKNKKIVYTAVGIAVYVILGMYSLVIGDFIKISLSFVSLMFIAYTLGPINAAICGGTGDIMLCILRPTGPYFLGFTLAEAISGAIFGLCLYGKEMTVKRIAITSAVKIIFSDIFLFSIFLKVLYGGSILALLSLRSIKALIMYPIHIILGWNLLKFWDKQRKES